MKWNYTKFIFLVLITTSHAEESLKSECLPYPTIKCWSVDFLSAAGVGGIMALGITSLSTKDGFDAMSKRSLVAYSIGNPLGAITASNLQRKSFSTKSLIYACIGSALSASLSSAVGELDTKAGEFTFLITAPLFSSIGAELGWNKK